MIVLLIAFVIYMNKRQQSPKSNLTELDGIPKNENLALTFIAEKMSTENILIYTNYKDRLSEADEISTGEDILSESQGLLLLYLLNRDRKEEFDLTLKSTLDELYLRNNTIAWVKKKKGESANINAYIDDLRIERALILAYEKWGDKSYFNVAKKIQKSLLKHNTEDNKIFDFYDDLNKESSPYITISYLDLYTTKKMSKFDEEWNEIYSRSLELIENAKIDDTGLYEIRYDYEQNDYAKEEQISLIQSVYSMIHLSEVSSGDIEGMNWVYSEYKRHGKLYESYSSLDLNPSSDIESTALYALLARLFYLEGDKEKAVEFLEQCEKFQIRNSDIEIYGAFGDENSEEVYSFDNLQYLLSSSMIYK